MSEDQTLPEAGVKEGDTLIVYPEIMAGVGPTTLPPSAPERKKSRPVGSYSIDRLRTAKQRFLAKCRGPRAVCPIEPNTVECIIDQFLAELK